MGNPKVFITNDPGLDFAKASKFGEVVRITKGPVSPFQPARIQHIVEEALEHFDVKTDYLCPSGAALTVGFAFGYVSSLSPDGFARVRTQLLLFDSKTREYFARAVEL